MSLIVSTSSHIKRLTLTLLRSTQVGTTINCIADCIHKVSFEDEFFENGKVYLQREGGDKQIKKQREENEQ